MFLAGVLLLQILHLSLATPLDPARIKRSPQGYVQAPPPYKPDPYVKPYQPPPPPPAYIAQPYDDKIYLARANELKKSAETYFKEFTDNSQIMSNSLKKIENIVVEVLNDQNQRKIVDDGIRYKRELGDKSDLERKSQMFTDFLDSTNKMGEKLKNIETELFSNIKNINSRRKRSPNVHPEPIFLDNVNMEVKVTNKNSQDMWDVSEFLLDDGVRKSILEAIKSDLHLTNPDDLKGIDQSMKTSFQKIRDESVKVDRPRHLRTPQLLGHKVPKHDVVSVKIPIAFDPLRNLA